MKFLFTKNSVDAIGNEIAIEPIQIEADRWFDAFVVAKVHFGTDRIAWREFPEHYEYPLYAFFQIRWTGSAASNTLQRIVTKDGKSW